MAVCEEHECDQKGKTRPKPGFRVPGQGFALWFSTLLCTTHQEGLLYKLRRQCCVGIVHPSLDFHAIR
ncbi:MAG: hypothetical protein H6Q30_3024 [Bacteroidetes bacterium]|nr:hypothetical protein [Bacteroidota bacterium]